MRHYSEAEGEQLARAARATIELFLRSPRLDRDILRRQLEGLGRPHGVFVNLSHYPAGEPRGRMGIYGTGKSMGELVVDAAIASAFEDPAFMPVALGETGHITVGVDVLSEFEEIRSSGKGKLMKMRLGRDGLCLRYGFKSAVLLPSFPEENGLNKIGFFEAACRTAGISEKLWMQPSIRMFRFETQRFAETEPDGRVREVKPNEKGYITSATDIQQGPVA